MENYLADTVILVDHLRGKKEAFEFLQQTSVSISHVTIAELVQGTKDKIHLQSVKNAVKDLLVLPITETISGLAVKLMEKFFLSNHLEYLDVLIAATAIANKLTLVTANAKHFRYIKELKVIPWPINKSE